jgi:hypothetical protein
VRAGGEGEGRQGNSPLTPAGPPQRLKPRHRNREGSDEKRPSADGRMKEPAGAIPSPGRQLVLS